MDESASSDAMRAVRIWIRYLEMFPRSEMTVQKLLDYGLNYREIIEKFEKSIACHQPLYTETLEKKSHG